MVKSMVKRHGHGSVCSIYRSKTKINCRVLLRCSTGYILFIRSKSFIYNTVLKIKINLDASGQILCLIPECASFLGKQTLLSLT